MNLLIICLFIIIIGIVLSILYINGYNKLSTIMIKLENSNKKIEKNLHSKYEKMQTLVELTKNTVKKKDYLKEFNKIKIDTINNYDLDIKLDNTLDLLYKFKDDFDELNTQEYQDLLDEIREIDQVLYASKKYYNKNNNLLIKQTTGYYRIIAKFMNIKTQNSYELKEPIKD